MIRYSFKKTQKLKNSNIVYLLFCVDLSASHSFEPLYRDVNMASSQKYLISF